MNALVCFFHEGLGESTTVLNSAIEITAVNVLAYTVKSSGIFVRAEWRLWQQ